MWQKVKQFLADPFGRGALLDECLRLQGELLVRNAKQRRAEGHIIDLKKQLHTAREYIEAADKTGATRPSPSDPRRKQSAIRGVAEVENNVERKQ